MGGPGLAFATWVFREDRFLKRNPGLRSETWATHSIFVHATCIFLGGLQAQKILSAHAIGAFFPGYGLAGKLADERIPFQSKQQSDPDWM
jgi:hypothetical protein